MAAHEIEIQMERARGEWKEELAMGNTTEPFKSWSQVNSPELQDVMRFGDAERALFKREQFEKHLRDDRFSGGLQRPRIESEADLERNDQRFRDIENKISSGFPQGNMQILEMQDFIKDQVARVSDDEKKNGKEEIRPGVEGDWTPWAKLDKLYQRMIRNPLDLSENELRECVPLLWDLVP